MWSMSIKLLYNELNIRMCGAQAKNKTKKTVKKQGAGAIKHHQSTHEKTQRLTQKKKAHTDTHVVN